MNRSSARWRDVVHFFTHHGLPLLFLVVMLESFGLPLPGETTLITFGILAAHGNYDIAWVIAITAAAAIIGDNLGYWGIGRLGGRRLFERSRWLNQYAHRVLPPTERVMQRHGAKTVFIGRFLPVLRFTAAWMAGLGKMPWWRFLFWNMVGGVAWAVSVGLAAYFAGEAAKRAIEEYGVFAGAAVVAVVILSLVASHFVRRRIEQRL